MDPSLDETLYSMVICPHLQFIDLVAVNKNAIWRWTEHSFSTLIQATDYQLTFPKLLSTFRKHLFRDRLWRTEFFQPVGALEK